MTEISCGSKVVKPNGVVTNVTTARMDGYDDDELVEVNAPIRVRVSRECYAESLVTLAEDCGFEVKVEPGPVYPSKGIYGFNPNNKMCIHGSTYHDLTYRDDLPQIEGWLEYHSESEDDECFVCNGSGDVVVDCPNCTDEYEDYGEPEYLNEVQTAVDKVMDKFHEQRNFSDYTMRNVILGPLIDFCGRKSRKVNDLESEIQDVREERDYWSANAMKFMDQRDNLQERIEKARALLDWGYTQYPVKAVLDGEDWKEWVNEEHCEDIEKTIKENPDSDEGDGCGELE